MNINIEELARQAGFRAGRINSSSGESLLFIAPSSSTDCADQVAALIQLVAAAVKEEAAKVITRPIEVLMLPDSPQFDGDTRHIERRVLIGCAAAIRAMEVKT